MKLETFRQDFLYFAQRNLIFFALQIFYYWLISNNFTRAITLPFNIYLFIIGETAIQVVLYLLVAGIQTYWLWGICQYPARKYLKKPRMRRILFFATAIFLLTMNDYFFPLSRFNLLLFFLKKPVIDMALWLSLACIIGLSINAWLHTSYKKSILFFTLIGTFFCFIPIQLADKSFQQPPSKLPNIIIIGIDSLNLSYISPHTTPAISSLLSQGVHFTDTISPLARTYPAWTSILTGLYPYHHHARENLTPAQFVKSEASILWRLRELGYSTFFASDDRRFNNLDNDFGFQTIIGPPLGINDILLGSFYDFPLSNLLLNCKIGKWLFPYNHMNRASQYSYFPNTFDDTLKQAIQTTRTQSPTFIAVHFTLPHWPYAWAVSSATDARDIFHLHQKRKLYAAAIEKVDQQVAKLYATLEQQGLLSNSMVILLSDHGEAFYEKGSRITLQKNYQEQAPSPFVQYLKKKTSTSLERSTGHGSDLLSPEQFQCLLNIQIRKNNRIMTQAHTVSSRVALIDIAPTIFSWLKDALRPNEQRHFDGISLLESIRNPAFQLPRRNFILESGLLPNQVLSSQKAIYYAQRLYHVNPENNHLEIKPSSLSTINAMKLYGILQDHWLLALYPYNKSYLPVIIDLQTKNWTDSPGSTYGKKTPFQPMLSTLQAFYHSAFTTQDH